jgi:hypothetical protein
VQGALIAIQQTSQESFTYMQNVMNTQITNVVAMQPQTDMFTMGIDQEIDMLHKEVPQSFALRAKAEKTDKGLSPRQGKEVPRAILAKDIEWQARFEDLAKHISMLSKSVWLDAKSIAEVKILMAMCPSTALTRT